MVLKAGRAVSCMKSKESSARRAQGGPRPRWLRHENSCRDTCGTEMENDKQLEGAHRTRIAVGPCHLALCANGREGGQRPSWLPVHTPVRHYLFSLSRPFAFMFAFQRFGVDVYILIRPFHFVAYGAEKGVDETEYILDMRMYPSSPLRLLPFMSAVSAEQKEDFGPMSRRSPPCASWGNI